MSQLVIFGIALLVVAGIVLYALPRENRVPQPPQPSGGNATSVGNVESSTPLPITSSIIPSSSLPSVATPTTPTSLRAPYRLTATPVSGTLVVLHWRTSNGGGNGFSIERSFSPEGEFVPVGMVSATATTYLNGGLAPGTTYYYRVRAFGQNAVPSPYSDTATVTTPLPSIPLTYGSVPTSPYSAPASSTVPVPPSPPPLSSPSSSPAIPAPPSNLTASALSPTQVTLRWTSNSTNEAGFVVERMPPTGQWVQVATVGNGVTVYTDTGLASPGTYSWRVHAYNSAGDSSYSNIAIVVLATPLLVTLPATPLNLVANAVSQTQINLSWVRNSANESGFTIERMSSSSQWSQIATLPAGVLIYQDASIISPGTYFYRVYAYNSAGASPYSSVASGTISCPSSFTTMLPRDLWVWQSAVATNPASTTAFFSFTDAHAIRTAYLESESLIQSNQPALANFINQANAHCVSVELLFGYAPWALTANQPYAVSLAQDAVAFANTTAGIRPAGVHYDVEPYVLSQWSTDQNGTANQYLDLLVQIASTTKGTGLRFTEDIPFWFDNVTSTRNGQTIVLGQAVINTIDRGTITDFRDTASQIISLAADETNYASTVGKQIIIGVNTTCGSLSYTTFCSDGATVMEQVLGQVNIAYATSSAFKGFAIHDYIGYQVLPP